jgi:nitrite reductase/ring-hydroxylating ferredoxin subunit
VKCPQHGFMFRLKDGKAISLPGLDLKTFEVNTDGGTLKSAVKP